MKKLAQITSLIFDPRIEVPLMLIVAVVNAYNNGATLLFLSLLLFLDAGLPLYFYLYQRRTGQISHWDIIDRDERKSLYAFSTLVHLAGVGVAFIFGQIALAKVLAVFWFLALMFTAVTYVWKISIHAGVNSAFATYLFVTLGERSVWFFVILILVCWSRIKLGRHGLAQVLVGSLLGALGVLGGMRVLGI